MNIWTVIAAYVACFISTKWVIKQYHKQQSDNLEIQKLLTSNQEAHKHHLPLEDILSRSASFDLFANHLVKEFSIENLAFVFEVMQIKLETVNRGFVFSYIVLYVVR